MAFAHSAAVLAEGNVEHPRQAVFDSPETARRVGKDFGVADAFGADVERPFDRSLAVDLAPTFRHAHARQFRPVLPDWKTQPAQVAHPPSAVARDN